MKKPDKKPKIGPLQNKPYTPNQMPSLVDSHKRKLDVGRIVVTDCYQTKEELPPNVVAMALLMELQQPGTVKEQFGNTLFIAHQSKERGKFTFRALNADTIKNYSENMKKFFYWMEQQGATELATQFTGEDGLQFMESIAKEMAQKDKTSTGYRAYKRDDEYLVVITLVGA